MSDRLDITAVFAGCEYLLRHGARTGADKVTVTIDVASGEVEVAGDLRREPLWLFRGLLEEEPVQADGDRG